MKNKRGLSQVVMTLIIVLLVIVAVGLIWVVINQFFLEGTSKISLSSFTIDLEVVSAKINYSDGVAEVKVKRNRGEGNLTGIKFIVKDSRNSEVFERSFSDFEEYAQRTFDLDLMFVESDLLIDDIQEISVAPIYMNGNQRKTTGRITSTLSIVQDDVVIHGDTVGGGVIEGDECSENWDCGEDYFINDTEICNELNDGVLQYEKIFTCASGFCITENVLVTIESCGPGFYCSDAACVMEPILCTEETVEEVCGVDGFTDVPFCQSEPAESVQDYRTYSCVNSLCEVSIETIVLETCNESEVCEGGVCFVPVECITNNDCDVGYVCDEGSCVEEVALNTGTIYSVWPPNVGELFDSADLPTDDSLKLNSKYIIFPETNEIRCLRISEFVIPESEAGISYIRLNNFPTNISSGDNYEIWETSYACTLI